jgi:hypothetical protein
MAYSTFKLDQIPARLGIQISTIPTLFPDLAPVEIGDFLRSTLADQVPLALSSLTEKARSELIISPILVEIWRRTGRQISLFSGVTMDVDPALDLVGVCDFVIVGEPNAVVVTHPILAIVEAKNDDLRGGLGQCIATMVAAAKLNAARGLWEPVYGVVTTGTVWRFLRLIGETAHIEQREQTLDDLEHILATLLTICMPR